MAKEAKTAPAQSAVDSGDEDFIIVEVELIREYANNPRQNDSAVEQMANLIAAHGFRVPILVQTSDDGQGYDLIDGHLRIKAARSLGITEVPAFLVDDMPEEQVKAFRISVNRAAELAGWDYDKLASELKVISTSFDSLPSLTGFDDDALSALAKNQSNELGKLKADGLPPRKAEPVSKQADHKQATRDTDSVSLTLGMTAAEREEAMAGLDAVCKARGISTRSAAVLQLIRDAVAVGKVETPKAETAKPRSRAKK